MRDASTYDDSTAAAVGVEAVLLGAAAVLDAPAQAAARCLQEALGEISGLPHVGHGGRFFRHARSDGPILRGRLISIPDRSGQELQSRSCDGAQASESLK